MKMPVMSVMLMIMRVLLSILTVGVVHTCSLTGGYFKTFAPRLGFKSSVLMDI